VLDRRHAYEILRALSRRTMSYEELAGLGVPRETLTHRLRELVELGWVVRRSVRRGRKRTEYSVTGLGERALKRALRTKAIRIVEDCADLMPEEFFRILLERRPSLRRGLLRYIRARFGRKQY